ncbi:MAG: hypothetical protein U0N82_09140 [Oscillospiraceae bacterium]
MSGQKINKAGISVVCIFLCVLILFFCAVKQRSNGDKLLSRNSLASCEKVLALLQSAENCNINAYRTFDGQLSLDSRPHERYWKHGADWMQIKDTGELVFAYCYRDGVYYDTVGTAGVENGHILWNAGTDRGNQKPWLLDFQWNQEKVSLLDRYRDEEGTHILLDIAEPVIIGDAAADSYTAEFIFHKDRTFANVLLKAALKDSGGNIRNLEEIQFASTHNSDWIKQQMEVAFRSKNQPLVSSMDGNTVTYGALSIILPDGYSCREGNGTGLLLLKNGEVAGGITHWDNPEEEEDWLESLGLWAVMSGASYMLMWGDGDASATFVNEVAPEKLNHGHNFYIRGDIVYNVWVNENLMTGEERSALLKTVEISDQIPSLAIQEVPLIDLSRLPKGYSSEAQDNGSSRILKGTTVIGSVDVYTIPGGEMTTWDPYFRWLGSLGIPDYGDDSLCYMGGSSIYGNWEMHFQSDLPPGQVGTVDRYHTFYVGRMHVWDIWFDLTVIDRPEMNKLLEAVTLR